MRGRILPALLASTTLMLAGGASYAASNDDGVITGTVTGQKGPEAGVWVIAETKDAGTPMIKTVVTNDKGQYLLPQLPKGKYKLWVRGYGIVDSKPVETQVGATVNVSVKSATPKEAAEVYPANYWEALIKMPDASEFPGTGPTGNGINPGFGRLQDWLGHFKEQCHFCHQQGTKITRTLDVPNHVEAWDQRIQKTRPSDDPEFGPHGKEFSATMVNNMTRFGKQRGLNMWADWTKAIAGGALPPEAPPRPTGVERNVVLTSWDFAGGHFVHDEATSDKRNPEVNANGPVYGTDTLLSNLAVLDPTTGKTKEIPIPGLTDANKKQIAATQLSVHNPMLDEKGRVWMTMLQGEGAPLDACEDGPNALTYAKYYPNPFGSTRRISVYDPKTGKIDVIPTCFATHHINFGHDKDNTLYFSGDSNVLGWLDTKVWDETHDSKKAMGWCPFVLDTSGDGKIDPDRKNWNQPEGLNVKMADPKKDTRISGFPYGMNVSPLDESVWYAKYSPAVPSGVVRVERGSNPPMTCKTEYYEAPKDAKGDYIAYNARGVDIDSKGIAWVAFGSGQLGRFDRTKCKKLNGPTAAGQGCPEGWTFYDSPGPKLIGQTHGSTDWHYLAWVDLHNVLGLGKDVPFLPGNNSDSLLALVNEKWVVLRVPYPMGFFPRGLDARIDDPKTGWKGKGIWSNYAELPIFHQEDGEGSYSKMVKFQVRPDPLAR